MVDVDVSSFGVDKRLVDETVAVIVDAVAEFAFGRDGIAVPIVDIVFIFGANPSPDARADVAKGVFGADFVGFGVDGDVGIGGIDETVAIVVDSVANFGLRNSCVAFAPFVAVFRLLAIFSPRAGTEFVGIVARNSESDFSRTAIARIADGDALSEGGIVSFDCFARIARRAIGLGAVLGANHAVRRFDAQIARRIAMAVDGARGAKA